MLRKEELAETPMADGTNPFNHMGHDAITHLSTFLGASEAINLRLKTKNKYLYGFFSAPNGINHHLKFRSDLKHHFPHRFNQLNKSEGHWLRKFHYASTQDYANLTPEMAHLFASVKNGHLESVKAFFIKNPTLSYEKTWMQEDGSGYPLWYWVGRCSSQDVRDFYYEKMTAHDVPHEIDGKNLLHHAVIANRPDEVTQLLSEPEPNACSVNVKDNRGNTPLFLAGYVGHATLFLLLINYGADWLLRNADGNTPLAVATQQGHIGILELLLSRSLPYFPIDEFIDKLHAIRGGEEQDDRASWQSTLLIIATRAGHHDIMALLLQNGARTQEYEFDGRIIDVQGRRIVEESIINKDFDKPPTRQTYGHDFTPLLVAIMNDDCRAIQLLADHGADITDDHPIVATKHFHAYCPIQFAARFGCTRAAQLLLSLMKANRLEEHFELRYFSPLNIALRWKHFDTAICLIENDLTFPEDEIIASVVNRADIRKWRKNMIRHIEKNISDEAEQARLLELTETFFSEQAERIPKRGCRIS